MSFNGGAGRFSLDFTGESLAADGEANIEVGMADLQVTLPAGRAIVLDVPESAFVSVSVPDEFVREGGSWHSPEVRDHDDAFHVSVDAGPGRVEVRLSEERR
jgi:hypothetical protein